MYKKLIEKNCGQVLKTCRKYFGITQVEMIQLLEESANRSGFFQTSQVLTQGTLSKIEKGILAPSVDLWFLFVEYFGLDDGRYCAHTGRVEFKNQALEQLRNTHSDNKLKIDPRFYSKAGLKIRYISSLLDFIVKMHGPNKLNEELIKIGVDPDYLNVLDNEVNPLFIDELVRIFKIKNLEKMVFSMADYKLSHGALFSVYLDKHDTIEMTLGYLRQSSMYDKYVSGHIIDQSKTGLKFERALPAQFLKSFSNEETIKNYWNYQTAYLAHLPALLKERARLEVVSHTWPLSQVYLLRSGVE